MTARLEQAFSMKSIKETSMMASGGYIRLQYIYVLATLFGEIFRFWTNYGGV
jgi:hypothetical protein